MTKTKGRIVAAVLLMSVTSFAQDSPHLISRPAVVIHGSAKARDVGGAAFETTW
jgi:hypothetical protein